MTNAQEQRFCESCGAVLGIASGFDVWHLGMTHNGSGAHVGCLGDELSAVVPASTWHAACWLDEQPVQTRGVVTHHRSAARCPPGRPDQANDREEPWR
jgi:hypothetical protein